MSEYLLVNVEIFDYFVLFPNTIARRCVNVIVTLDTPHRLPLYLFTST